MEFLQILINDEANEEISRELWFAPPQKGR